MNLHSAVPLRKNHGHFKLQTYGYSSHGLQENDQSQINMTLPISEKYSDLFDERAGLLIGALKALCVMEH